VFFCQADDRFPSRVVWYKGCCNREDAAQYCGLADILQKNVVSQKHIVWVGYDRQAVRTLHI
jgi:hypothetical protein